MAQYGKLEYWEDRYTRDQQPFEWFQRYVALKPFFETEFDRKAKILQVGCGTSRLGEDMYEDGYTDIKCTDFSEKAIEIMSKRAVDKPGLTYAVEDVLLLTAQDEAQYDVVIDKGTLDSILCGDGSFQNVQKMLAGISKVLKPGGVFIEISYGGNENRLPYLQVSDLGWTVSVNTVPKPQVGVTLPSSSTEGGEVHYIYKCRKGQ
ncbi:putative Endothelin-converting enzyme 2 A (Ece2A) [Monocercomonoides exilis]|uniref:putative Endothelin-converting enzyme 2 A (Ece2A) n=1 Tax=Monocercomonoides exilis TaxID=2049356 RepID=UPI003559F719|nr:putative Endothelin-converting enzyme 2 A (Ece2A) [Monocercomonoides exilis]|eukprot:MONOS_4277.1-p1 / transcript=MONOS_4277.1 / gene=MONOS_4277 / organism=Monocercomonoides_exilis_PA203 / gene_product=Endothelin-converting enzyme 2 A (Ece2A) / transcript_product=Endothelin-converting enzyme 2 A (Ece2A) / location=Mono_scaffold00111:111999-112947(-) / protein_length=205 / sequence_SO=supercontig / SO=protein_coding / is_pseudo=false